MTRAIVGPFPMERSSSLRSLASSSTSRMIPWLTTSVELFSPDILTNPRQRLILSARSSATHSCSEQVGINYSILNETRWLTRSGRSATVNILFQQYRTYYFGTCIYTHGVGPNARQGLFQTPRDLKGNLSRNKSFLIYGC